MNDQKHYQNHVLVGMCVTLVALTMAMVQYKIPTIMVPLMQKYDMDASTASWLMSIFTLMMVFTAIPFGTLAQRVGSRKVIAIAVVVIVCGSVVGAFSTSAIMLLVTRAIEGVAITAVTICGPVLIESAIDPGKVGSALGIWGTWGPLGSTFAALITPTLFAFGGMSGLWLVYAGLVVIAAVVMLVLVREPSRGDEDDVSASQSAKPRYRDVFTKGTMLFFAGFAAFNICMLAVLSFVPTILQHQGMDATLSGLVSTVPMILSVISSPVFGALSDKTGKTRMLLVITVAFLGPCAFLMYTQTGVLLWVGAIAMGVIGMGSSGLMIVGFMKALPSPELKTIGMGVFITVQGVGQFLGTFLVQLLLGPQLDHLVLAGSVVMVLGLLGALCLGLCGRASHQG